MHVTGIIAEYNPLHGGHLFLMEEARRMLGADTAIIGVMSGNFVQRGDFALLRKHARAEAAARSGMDLVLELPLPWAVSSAERFADGGVQTLLGTGLVTDLLFGSECGDAEALRNIASVLLQPETDEAIRRELQSGVSYAAARQRALEVQLGPQTARLLEQPNNTLGIEYCKALIRRGSGICPRTVQRRGAEHHDGEVRDGVPSAALLRSFLHGGEREKALSLLPPAMQTLYAAEEAAGRAPVFSESCERAMLARLRSMTETDFAALDEGNEGLYHRLYELSRSGSSLEELLSAAKTKRYAYARLRRMVLWAYLGIAPGTLPDSVPYLRVLAANETGRALLGRMRKSAALPILTKPADVRRLSPQAQALFTLEVRATDLYTLAYPELAAAGGGAEWRIGPVII